MPRTNTKTTKAKATAAPVAETAPAAPAASTASKKKTTKKEETTPAPVVDTPAAPAPVVEEETVNYASMNATLVVSLQRVINETKDAIKTVRTMKTMHEKEVKENKNNKKKEKRTRTSQAGFAVATKITPQLAAYIGVDSVDSLSRTDAVKKIHERIVEKNLQDPEDRRIIRYENDKELKALLGLPEAFKVNNKGEKDTKLSYFNLQRYISHHFIKE
ncbi:SWIB/MDM2 domain-containing protein [bacterium]|nr:SWIB/MDM2 domain-containing protein [bacterium]